MGAGRKNRTLFVAVNPVGDRFIEHGPETTVADLIGALGVEPSGAAGVRVQRTAALLPPELLLAEADIRSGDALTVTSCGPRSAAGSRTDPTAPATLRIDSGSLAGTTFSLGYGENTVGRLASNDVVILDPGVSRHHGVITVTPESITVLDQQSTNGIAIDGRTITEPTEVSSGKQMIVGHLWISIDHHRPTVPPRSGPPLEPGVPSGRSTDRSRGRTITLPTPPDQTGRRRPSEILPTGRGQHRLAVERFHAEVDAVEARLRTAAHQELAARLRETPSVDEVVAAIGDGHRLWERRTSDLGGLEVRLGLGEVPSRTTVELPPGGDQELRRLVTVIPARYRTLSGAPIVADFRRLGSLGLGGTADVVNRLAYALIAQLAWFHGPDQLGIAHRPRGRQSPWDWLKWLPHVDFAGAANGIADEEFVAWVAALLDGAPPAAAASPTTRAPATVDAGAGYRPARPAAIVLVLDREGSLPTALMARLIQEGPALGVYSLLLGHHEYDLGVSPGGVIMVGPDHATVKRGFDGAGPDIAVESIDLETVTALARTLTSVGCPIRRGPSKMAAVGRPVPGNGLVIGPFGLGLADPLGDATVVPPNDDDRAEGTPEPPRAPHQSGSRGAASTSWSRSPARRRDLKSLPHGDDDSRLILGTVHGGGRSDVGVFACNLSRDGSLCITGDRGFGKTSALRSVAAAAALLRVPPDRLPITYYLDVRGDLEGIGVLPHTVGASRDDLGGFRTVAADLERLLTDRAAGFAQAHVETFDEYRRLAPQSSLRRAVVLVDEVDAFIGRMDLLHPGRGLALLEQLAEHGTRFGIHLIISAVDPGDVAPSLAQRLGRWLHLGSTFADGTSAPGTAAVGASAVRFATIGGARASHRALVELADQLAGRGVTPTVG